MEEPETPRKSGLFTRMLALAMIAAAALGLAWYLNTAYLVQKGAPELRGQNVREFEAEKAEYEAREGSGRKAPAEERSE